MLEQGRNEAVPEGMRAYRSCQTRPPHCHLDGLIDHCRVNVLAPHDFDRRISRHVPGRKQVLPDALPAALRPGFLDSVLASSSQRPTIMAIRASSHLILASDFLTQKPDEWTSAQGTRSVNG